MAGKDYSIVSDEDETRTYQADEYDLQYIKSEYDRHNKSAWPKDNVYLKEGFLCITTDCPKTIKTTLEDIVRDKYRDALDVPETKLQQALQLIDIRKREHKYRDILAIQKKQSTEIIIISSNYEKIIEFKHSLQIKLTRKNIPNPRKDRQFDPHNGSINNGESTDNRLHDFMTYEGIEVHAGVVQDILELDGEVKCIVNPTNSELSHSGEISKKLLQACGDTYKEECKTRCNVELTKCVVTKAGQLKTEHIMHAVCPAKHFISRTATLENAVFETVRNCLLEAESLGITSIAFPFLSSGRGKVPFEICSKQYANAILEFSRKRKNTFSCNTIYFVDINEERVKRLIAVFKQCLPQNVLQRLQIPIDYILLPCDMSKGTEQIPNDGANGICDNSSLTDNIQPYSQVVDGEVDDGTGYETIDDERKTSDINISYIDDEDGYESFDTLRIYENDKKTISTNEAEINMENSSQQPDISNAIDAVHIETTNEKTFEKREENQVDSSHPESMTRDKTKDNTGSKSSLTNAVDGGRKKESKLTDHIVETTTVSYGAHEKDQTDMATVDINACTVKIYKDDIRGISVDAVVCPEDLHCPSGGHGHMAASIKAVFRHSFNEEKLKKLKEKKFKQTKNTAVTVISNNESKDNQNIRFLLHVATPFHHGNKSAPDTEADSAERDKKTFETDLHVKIKCAFEKIEKFNNKRRIRSVAFPLMGIDDVGDKDAIRRSCKVTAMCVVDFCKTQRQSVKVKEVHLVSRCPKIAELMFESIKWLTE